MNNISQNFVGIDISKKTLDIHVYPLNKSFKVPNTQSGIEKLIADLKPLHTELTVCEATGGYESLLLKMFHEASINIWLVDPKRARAFIIFEGINAKTDKIDAHMLALFASKKMPKHQLYALSQTEELIRELVRRRKQLVINLTQEKIRLDKTSQEYCKQSVQDHIDYLLEKIDETNKEIDTLISADADLNNKRNIIESVPGVGKITAFTLLAHMPELGHVNKKQIAALLGVVPYVRQSGNYKGTSGIKGGRGEARDCMYMAAVSASQYNQPLKKSYDKWIEAGKKPKVALGALMHKMIVRINTMIKNNELWNASYQ